MAKPFSMRDLAATAKTTTVRLALSYLAIIMGMSIGFSVVFYSASVRELSRQLPPSSLFEDEFGGQTMRPPRFDAFFEDRIAEGRQVLLRRLIALNILTVVAGGALSYFLARRTLLPIEEAMEAQAQFVSDASHELRTPLTAIQTVNEVALRRKRLRIDDAREIISHNVAEVVKLKALTDGLLRLARHENQLAAVAAVSLQDVVAEAMERVVVLAQAKSMTVDDQVTAIKVLAEPQALSQIVVILLDNAVKYAPKASTIYLTSEARSKYAYLHVRDEGPGIRTYDQRRIFDRFYRADQSRSKHIVEGHGIGLSLAKKLAEDLGGDISVASTVGTGSTFTIKLPLAS